MATRSGAGALNKRVEFQSPVPVDDGHGGSRQGWEPQFSCPARLTPRIGGEEVVAQRLQGKQPYILRVRGYSQTRQVRSDWRAVNSRTGEIYAIKSMANLDERGAYIDMLVVEGDAD